MRRYHTTLYKYRGYEWYDMPITDEIRLLEAENLQLEIETEDKWDRDQREKTLIRALPIQDSDPMDIIRWFAEQQGVEPEDLILKV